MLSMREEADIQYSNLSKGLYAGRAYSVVIR